jgi:hypothetical protein
MSLLVAAGDVGNSASFAVALACRDLNTGETLMQGVDQHHRYSMMSPGCRLVDLRMNVEGAAGLKPPSATTPGSVFPRSERSPSSATALD